MSVVSDIAKNTPYVELATKSAVAVAVAVAVNDHESVSVDVDVSVFRFIALALGSYACPYPYTISPFSRLPNENARVCTGAGAGTEDVMSRKTTTVRLGNCHQSVSVGPEVLRDELGCDVVRSAERCKHASFARAHLLHRG